mgnify:FL=1
MACKCDVGLSNTGTACTPLQAVARQYVMVNKYKADGTLNKLVVAAGTYTTSFWNTQLNAVADERWRPIGVVKNVADEKADNITQSFNDGSTAFIAEGARTVAAFLPGAAPHLVGQINDARCIEIAMYVIDKDGNLIGKEIEEGFLHPICVENDTISASYVKNDASATISGINLSFTWSLDEKDENMTMITVDEMTDGVSGISGLLDIAASYTSITTDGFVATLTVNGYGTALTPVYDKGLVFPGDFSLFNDSDSLAVTITSVTESTGGGVYTFIIPTQSTTDSMTLTPSKDGRDYTLTIAAKVVIP